MPRENDFVKLPYNAFSGSAQPVAPHKFAAPPLNQTGLKIFRLPWGPR